MVLVKILGFIDLAASIILLCMTFSLSVPYQIIVFFGGILLLKGGFIINGNLFSLVDLLAAIVLFIGIFFSPAVFLLWILSLFLMAKGAASFL